jgi:uncharacterized membrane protein (DUF485 family)
MNSDLEVLRGLVRLRWRMAMVISAIMVVLYFGFILLIAFNKDAMARELTPGLSVGIVFGAAVIALTWATTWYYVRWARLHVDTALARHRGAK